ncbi:MAG: 23S rRNA (adenine(1618)-N(6))-methyltransferase RlmF [Bacteroidota bacterium]|nr:23S rRNA (adenine(1618)-N(6))-methyltransferase RlmF [Bacteroidota bacterium]
MQEKKKEHPKEKSKLHPRNKNRERYDFKKLIDSYPVLDQFVILNKYKDESIDFTDPFAVKALNTALLKYHYGIEHWDIPKNYLVPPVPGRADYIHHIADLLGKCNQGNIPKGPKIQCFDVGVGANCIYPIIGNKEYGWSFVGSETDTISLNSARNIVTLNPSLTDKIDVRFQKDSKDFFFGIVRKAEHFDFSICNPPFHSSAKEAHTSSLRKQQKLSKQKVDNSRLNFAGKTSELSYEGGESTFVWRMINQSKKFSPHFFWFSTLISKQSNLKNVYTTLKKVGAKEVETIAMGQGNKTSRIVAWTFLSKEEQKKWVEARWL